MGFNLDRVGLALAVLNLERRNEHVIAGLLCTDPRLRFWKRYAAEGRGFCLKLRTVALIRHDRILRGGA